MARDITIGSRRIADNEPPFVIAEIGHNHAGSIEKCREMFRVAKQAGCDAVKLQKRQNETLFTKQLADAPYSSEHAFGDTYLQHRQALEFSLAQYTELKAYAESLGLIFFATAFDIPSATFLAELGVPAIKIASGDLTNQPLLEHCASLGLPLIVSTGGHDMDDVDRTVRLLLDLRAPFALLQATATYPCKHEELNLRVIQTYRQWYPDIVVGLSDHQDGISMAPVAWMLGARIFEKHFTLSRAAKGSDNAFSLEPEPMRKMVNDLKGVREALGDGVKKALQSEIPAIHKMGKALYFARDLPAGHVLRREDIAIKSPWGPVPPYRLSSYIGKRLAADVEEDQQVNSLVLELEKEEACSFVTSK